METAEAGVVAAPEVLEASLLDAMVLGVLQGITEFVPVSSSGLLVLFQQFFHVQGDHLVFDVALHLGTLIPVLVFYRADLLGIATSPFNDSRPWMQRPGVRLLALLFVASLPTAVVGLLFEEVFRALFNNPAALTLTFAITGSLLYATRKLEQGPMALAQLGFSTAFFIGCAQALAIAPGISRSGTTIAIALLLGMEREGAARFSFLMSIPAVGGAALLQARHIDAAGLDWGQLGVGIVAAGLTGYAALSLLVWIVKRGRISAFAWFCWSAALVSGGLAIWGVWAAA